MIGEVWIRWSDKRICLKEEDEGVYVFVYNNDCSSFPDYDYLQGNWEAAKGFCIEDLGVPADLLEGV